MTKVDSQVMLHFIPYTSDLFFQLNTVSNFSSLAYVNNGPNWTSRKNSLKWIELSSWCNLNCLIFTSAIEWENSSTSRVVSIRLGPGTFIRVVTNGNQVSRIINVQHMNWITAVRQSDREQNTLSLRVQREYDLVNMSSCILYFTRREF